ncbi:MAG TPA: hypothetical protein VFI74_02070 [Candidatus Saccharimonadales bacterium]|nr:hypothetical protein [Candidatus Saccharimonadales bacterium]
MYSNAEATLGGFIEQLTAAQKGVIAGIAQEALEGAGVILEDRRYLDAMSHPSIQQLPGISAAQETIHRTFTAFSFGLPAPDRV